MRKIFVLAVVAVLALVGLTAASPAPAAAWGPTPGYHVVQPGETLSSIAWRYGVTTWSIASANGIWNPNYIYVGQVLVIQGGTYPCPGCPYPWPQPAPKPQPYPGPIYRCSYRVQYGDTMSAIAWRLRVDVWTLARTNGIYNLNWIYAGQWLRIPGCYQNPQPMPGPVPNPNPYGP
jgi:LysM repeat protein